MEAIKTAWDFFQHEILGMHWLNRFISTMLNACGLDTTGKIGGSIQFFLYDTIKIMVLLGVLILMISYIQSYFPPERTKKILGRFHGIWANILAALLGTVTPFCSCSSIPCGGSACERGIARCGAVVYDGGYHTFSALHDYAAQGGKTKTAGYLYCDMYCGYHRCGIFLQRYTKCYIINSGGNS